MRAAVAGQRGCLCSRQRTELSCSKQHTEAYKQRTEAFLRAPPVSSALSELAACRLSPDFSPLCSSSTILSRSRGRARLDAASRGAAGVPSVHMESRAARPCRAQQLACPDRASTEAQGCERGTGAASAAQAALAGLA